MRKREGARALDARLPVLVTECMSLCCPPTLLSRLRVRAGGMLTRAQVDRALKVLLRYGCLDEEDDALAPTLEAADSSDVSALARVESQAPGDAVESKVVDEGLLDELAECGRRKASVVEAVLQVSFVSL